jgi:hypothetical protein
MITRNKFITSALLAFVASTSVSFAEPTVWDFATDATNYDVDNSANAFGNLLSIDSDNDGNPELTIQAWADTGCGWSCGNDDHVQQGFASTNSGGLLNYNLDDPSGNGNLQGEDHVIDNKADVDMMFFSFVESTALTGIDIGWANGDTDVSIAAFNTLPTLSGNTWSNIVGQSIFSSSFSNLGTAPYALANVASGAVVEAQYWLIGAYSSIFGDSGANDHSADSFKLASITTERTIKPSPKPPTDITEVSEPSTIALFASFGLFLMWRRKRSA